MQRLNNKFLKPLPAAFNCPSLSDDYITLALLNVRPIVGKLTDIEQDDSSSILCFTETWLTSLLSSPVLQENLRSDQIYIRR